MKPSLPALLCSESFLTSFFFFFFTLLQLARRTLSALQFFNSPFTTLSFHNFLLSQTPEEREHSFYGRQIVWSSLWKMPPETNSKGQSVSHKNVP